MRRFASDHGGRFRSIFTYAETEAETGKNRQGIGIGSE